MYYLFNNRGAHRLISLVSYVAVNIMNKQLITNIFLTGKPTHEEHKNDSKSAKIKFNFLLKYSQS